MPTETKVERRTDRELVATRAFDAPVRVVYRAWSQADLFRQWWVPRSFPIRLVACDMDVRVGGKYRLEFEAGGQRAAFFGDYLEVTPDARISWSNDESGPDGRTITTVTFEEQGGRTLVTMHDLYPSKAALDDAIESGATCSPETFAQLAELLPAVTA